MPEKERIRKVRNMMRVMVKVLMGLNCMINWVFSEVRDFCFLSPPLKREKVEGGGGIEGFRVLRLRFLEGRSKLVLRVCLKKGKGRKEVSS